MTTASPTFDTIRTSLQEHAAQATSINTDIESNNQATQRRLKAILASLAAVKEKMKKAHEAETGNAEIIKSLTDDSTAIKTALDTMETARARGKTEIEKDITEIEQNIQEMGSPPSVEGSEGGGQQTLRGGWRFPHREKKHNNKSTRNNSTRNKSGKKKSATRKSANKRKYNSSRRRLTR